MPAAAGAAAAVVGVAGIAAVAKAAGACSGASGGGADAEVLVVATLTGERGRREEVALARVQRICDAAVAGRVREVRVEAREGGAGPPGVWLAAVPDAHLANEERKLVEERAAAALCGDGGAARPPVRVVARPDAGAAYARDPYGDPAHAAVQRAVYDACHAPVVAAAPGGGVVSVNITEDGHYVRFATGVRLSVAQRYVIVHKYREKLRTAAKARWKQGVRVTLMDDGFDEEQAAGASCPADGWATA